MPRSPHRWPISVALALGMLLPAPATAVPPAWVVEGENSRVWLVGSLHYLRESDYPMPAPLGRAFSEADALILEYDASRQGTPIRPLTMNARLPSGARLPPSGPISRTLSISEFTTLRRRAEAHGYDVRDLNRFKPWFAGMYVMESELARHGFLPDFGLDNVLAERARERGLPVLALESAGDQRRLFQDIPVDDQVDFLVSTIEGIPTLNREMSGLVSAWRSGDMSRLETRLLHGLRKRPDEYRRFVVDRNRRWMDRLEPMMTDGRDYLVVVGVLHLLGDDSLVALFGNAGYPVRPVEAAASQSPGR